ncbi:hypothetical protein Baya_15229 [Bagarius yarrelli]|uniref:Uncharacterized protein n=1 Tax=Bagarius yarrelli TaxID=175774 RepID=A0A556VV83_BAGYA|nr:hypothetical protein Baya_15229 [Bagarius yarrelli]
MRVHILRGCVSDPEVTGGILYRHGGMLQLNHVKGEGAKVDVWIPIRGTSQQEGYHFHQAQWVTGTGMTGVARWNFQHLVDLKVPGLRLPGLYDPLLIADAVSAKMLGTPKYPAFQVSAKDSGERFGLEYVEPGCRPVVLDWEKHKSKTTEAFNPAEQRSTHFPHPTTRLHIAQYVKHLAKLLNTNTSLNTNPEKLLERQQLWPSLTEGSETTRIPVVEMHPTALHPPAPALTTTLTPESLGQIDEGIMEKQQQQQQQLEQKEEADKNLSCL